MSTPLFILSYFTIFLVALTTLLNDYFAIYSILGFLIIVCLQFPLRPTNILMINFMVIWVIIYSIILLEPSSYVFFLNHLSYGIMSIYGFLILSKKAQKINRRLARHLLILNIVFCLMQFSGVIVTSHYPRLSGIYPNPNQLAVFCLFYLLLVQRNRIMILLISLLTRSNTFIPIIVLELFRNRIFYLSLLTLSASILLFNTTLSENAAMFFTKYLAFVDAVSKLSEFSLEQADDGNSYSAYKRVFYFLSTIDDLISFDSYFSVRPFQFREGFLLSIISVNQFLGFGLISYSIFLGRRFLRARQYALIFALLAWLFILPVFDPILLLLLSAKKN